MHTYLSLKIKFYVCYIILLLSSGILLVSTVYIQILTSVKPTKMIVVKSVRTQMVVTTASVNLDTSYQLMEFHAKVCLHVVTLHGWCSIAPVPLLADCTDVFHFPAFIYSNTLL